MKRKLVSLLLATAVVVGCLTGCGTGGKENSNANEVVETTEMSAEETKEKADTVLKWAVWDAKTTVYWQALADAYSEKNPNVKVELVDLGSQDYNTVLGTELSGSGTDLDIVTMKDMPGYATMVAKGVLEPLNEKVEADGIDLTQYKFATEYITPEGHIYNIPIRSDFYVLFYNKDIFDEAGVDYPTNDMTIEQYDELARKVAKTGFGDDRIYGTHYHPWKHIVQLFGILDGEKTILDGNYDFTTPYYEMVKGQEEDGICRSYVDTTAAQLHYSAAFAEGNTAMMPMGSWYVGLLNSGLANGDYDSELCGNWGMVYYPHPDGVEAGAAFGSSTGLTVPVASDSKDEAWDFIKFASGEEGAEIMASTGNFPALMTEKVIDTFVQLDSFPTDEASKEVLKTTKVYLDFPFGENVAEISTILDTYHKDIMNGDVSIEAGISKMNEEVSALE